MPGSDQRPGREQQIDPLGDDQLSDEDDAGRRGPSRGVPPRDPAAGTPPMSTPGGPRRVFSSQIRQTSGSAAQSDSAVWREPTRTPEAASHPLFGVGQEARVGFDRVLEGRAVDLGGEGADGGAGEDRRAHHQVVGEGDVDAAGRGRRPRGRRRRWRRGSGRARLVGQLREGLDLEALVGVLDVDRQQAADVGVVDLDALDPDLAVLAEQVDLVAEPGQRRGEVGVVDVAAGAAQHVAVEDEDAHRFRPSY